MTRETGLLSPGDSPNGLQSGAFWPEYLRIATSCHRNVVLMVLIQRSLSCLAQTLNEWVKRDEVDTGTRVGITTTEHEGVKVPEREIMELRRANEKLKLTSAFFAQTELDRRLKF